ncbi:uncharacterized protein N7484_005136 [Penicillium longicatenatum]|uniref:uncharacterized protein n=1 Tax=Penicillium longicatenatum TaxID=1561947 RepID=UPI002546E086|nr:uncharacterized protein N7484_005136 [Penicillium longicatenatum]KAJ5651413.1 hypothetical protein N7484_005136 [Penicillium longicatenatum]
MAKLEPMKNGYYLWHYVPSIAAAVIFVILFFVVTVFHFWKLFKSKARFTLPFAIGGLFEIIGFSARIAAHNHTGALIPYVIQSIFVLLAPILFAAAVYMVLARIICSVSAEQLSPIRIRWITKIFVGCDIITFLIQGSGAGMTAESTMSQMGQYIVLAGLALQILSFVLFLMTAIIFANRIKLNPTSATTQGESPWKKHLYSLYAISAMILLRSIFRVIEYGLGNDGYLLASEWPTYVLDATPMFIAMVCFAIWYPSELQQFLVRRDSENPLHSTSLKS